MYLQNLFLRSLFVMLCFSAFADEEVLSNSQDPCGLASNNALSDRLLRLTKQSRSFRDFYVRADGDLFQGIFTSHLHGLDLTEPERAQTERAAVRYINNQLIAGRLQNIVGMERLLWALDIDDLELNRSFADLMKKWLRRIEPAEVIGMSVKHFVYQQNGRTYFYSPMFKLNMPTTEWDEGRGQEVVREFYRFSLEIASEWFRARGVMEAELDEFMSLRDSIMWVGRVAKQRKVSPQQAIPRTLREVLRSIKITQ